MVNLLPQPAQQQLILEYRVRVVTVWLFLVVGAMLVLGSLLIPISVLVKLQLAAYDASYAEVTADISAFGEAELQVEKANETAQELDRIGQYTPLFTDVELVQSLTNDAIVLTSIRLVRETTGQVKQITVTGDAATRAELAAFRDRIEAHERFVSAALPLSNLAKDREIPFSITIDVALPTKDL